MFINDLYLSILLAGTNIFVFLITPSLKETNPIHIAQLCLAAICEELFFRGLLLSLLINKNHLSNRQACILVSILFGALHLINVYSYATPTYAIVQVYFAFSAGLMLAKLYLQYGLSSCILLHIVINLTSVLCESNSYSNQLSLIPSTTIIYLTISTLTTCYCLQKLKN